MNGDDIGNRLAPHLTYQSRLLTMTVAYSEVLPVNPQRFGFWLPSTGADNLFIRPSDNPGVDFIGFNGYGANAGILLIKYCDFGKLVQQAWEGRWNVLALGNYVIWELLLSKDGWDVINSQALRPSQVGY